MSREVNALYRIFDADDELLYIGITNNPRSRMMDHVRTKGWARRIAYITFEHFSSRDELFATERQAVADEFPTFNVAHNRGDDATDDTWEIEEYGPELSCTDVDRTAFAGAAAVMGKLLS